MYIRQLDGSWLKSSLFWGCSIHKFLLMLKFLLVFLQVFRILLFRYELSVLLKTCENRKVNTHISLNIGVNLHFFGPLKKISKEKNWVHALCSVLCNASSFPWKPILDYYSFFELSKTRKKKEPNFLRYCYCADNGSA